MGPKQEQGDPGGGEEGGHELAALEVKLCALQLSRFRYSPPKSNLTSWENAQKGPIAQSLGTATDGEVAIGLRRPTGGGSPVFPPCVFGLVWF